MTGKIGVYCVEGPIEVRAASFVPGERAATRLVNAQALMATLISFLGFATKNVAIPTASAQNQLGRSLTEGEKRKQYLGEAMAC